MAVTDCYKTGYTGYLSEPMGKECISFRQRRMSQLGSCLSPLIIERPQRVSTEVASLKMNGSFQLAELCVEGLAEAVTSPINVINRADRNKRHYY